MNNLKQQLRVSQDDQRSKSLDLREEAVTEREALLNDTERINHIAVLDKQIAIKQSIVDELQTSIDNMEDKLSKHTKFSKQRLDELSKQEAEAQKELFTSQRAAVEIDRRIANAKQEFALITADITQQKGYLKDQEAIVNNTIAEWNNQLTGFQAEADIISGKKRVASADFIRLEQEKEALQAEADNLENKCQELKQLYEERKLEYKGKLKLMALSIEKQQISFNEGQKAVEVRQKVLAQREEASTIKETVIRQKELDLSQRERRLQMQLNLQNM